MGLEGKLKTGKITKKNGHPGSQYRALTIPRHAESLKISRHGKEDTAMMCSLSQLDGASLDEVKAVEKRMGKTLLAYSCYETRPVELSAGELDEIQKLEKKLGIFLVAVK